MCQGRRLVTEEFVNTRRQALIKYKFPSFVELLMKRGKAFMSSTEAEGKVLGVRFKCIYGCKQKCIALREPAVPTGSLRPFQEQPRHGSFTPLSGGGRLTTGNKTMVNCQAHTKREIKPNATRQAVVHSHCVRILTHTHTHTQTWCVTHTGHPDNTRGKTKQQQRQHNKNAPPLEGL